MNEQELYVKGTKVYSRTGEEFALTLGWKPREYHGEAGYTTIVAVRWPGGNVTWLRVAALQHENGRWQIR